MLDKIDGRNMDSPTRGEMTRWLENWDRDPAAAESLMPVVYTELRKIARGFLRRERPDHTLQATALVHEAYLRLRDQNRVRWRDRSHFLALAARMMRRILVDHARRHGFEKRGGGRPDLPLSEAADLVRERPDVLVALDDALESLREVDSTKAAIVEYRFFGGMNAEEIAEIVGCAPITVHRHWLTARAWLYRELLGTTEDRPPRAQ